MGPQLEVQSGRLVKPKIELVTPSLQGEWFIHYTTVASIYNFFVNLSLYYTIHLHLYNTDCSDGSQS